MDCTYYVELISARLDGELDSQEEEKLQAHLAGCPRCRALADQLAGLHRDSSDLEELEAPEGFAHGVMERIRGENKVVPLFRRPYFKALAGLAACAVLCIGLYGAGYRDSAPAPMSGDTGLSAGACDSSTPEEEPQAKQAMESTMFLMGAAAEARSSDLSAPQIDGQSLEEGVVLTLERLPDGGAELLSEDAAVAYGAERQTYLFLTLEQIEQLEALAQEQGISASRSLEETEDGMCALVILDKEP